MVGWALFTGNDVSDGESSETLYFDDASELDPYAMSFQKPKKRKRTKPVGTAKERSNIHVIDFMTLINKYLRVEHFPADREKWIRRELPPLLTSKCAQAYPKGVTDPVATILQAGVTIRPASDVFDLSRTQLGLTEKGYQSVYKDALSGQAGTIFGTDGGAQIYLNSKAFRTTSSWFWDESSFGDVLRHEFIHAGGQGKTPGVFRNLRHDLAGFPAYKSIMQACR